MRALTLALEARGIAVASLVPARDSLAPAPGRGERFARERVRAVDAGRWGEQGLAAALERARAESRRAGDPARERELAFAAALQNAGRQLGGRTNRDGTIDFRLTHDDPDGSKRVNRARKMAAAAMSKNRK